LKKKQKKENKWNIKKQNFKTEKNRKQNKWGKNGKSKMKKGETGFVHLHFLCIYSRRFAAGIRPHRDVFEKKREEFDSHVWRTKEVQKITKNMKKRRNCCYLQCLCAV
jgi:hypothetical protein